MRPVARGTHPTDAAGNKKAWTEYSQSRGDLIDRIGEYCSFCEMHLDASLAVEHIQPKSLYPNLALEWDNFLLACTNCNSTKGDRDIKLNDYFWPHLDTDSSF